MVIPKNRVPDDVTRVEKLNLSLRISYKTLGKILSGYKLGLTELDSVIGEIPPGSNLIFFGPPMSGKSVLARIFLYEGLKYGEAGIYVSTKHTGEKVEEWYEERGLDLGGYKGLYGIVDCVSKTLRMDLSVQETEVMKRVSSAMDLTGISIEINNLLEEFWMRRRLRRIRVIIDSLSTLLMYSNLQTVYRFLHLITGRVRSTDAVGLYIIEEGMHEPNIINTLKQLSEGVLEIKEEGELRALRMVGLLSKPTSWYSYDINSGICVKGVI